MQIEFTPLGDEPGATGALALFAFEDAPLAGAADNLNIAPSSKGGPG